MSKINIKSIAGIAASILIFYFIYKYLRSNWNSLEINLLKVSWEYFIFAFVIGLINFFIYSYGWYFLLEQENTQISFIKINLELAKGNLGKYLPGRIWQFMGRIYLFNNLGYGKSRLLFYAFLEQYYILLSALFLFVISLFTIENSFLYINYILNKNIILSFILLLLFFFIHPLGLSIINKILVRLTKKKYLQMNITFKQSLLLFLIYFGYWLSQGVILLCLVKSLGEFSQAYIFYVLGINAISYVIGYLSIIAPAGLGIREGSLTYFLDIFLKKGLGAIIAILERMILVIAELFYFLISLFVYRILIKIDKY